MRKKVRVGEEVVATESTVRMQVSSCWCVVWIPGRLRGRAPARKRAASIRAVHAASCMNHAYVLSALPMVAANPRDE
jgi:hypothetical protein